MRTKPLTIADLPQYDRTHEERTDADGNKYILVGKPVMLYCRDCGETYSATRGDYWYLPDDREMRCKCGEPLRLVRKVERYEDV